MGVWKFKGIKTITNTEEFWPAAGRAHSAHQNIQRFSHAASKLPPGAFIRNHPNPDHTYRAILLSAGKDAPPGADIKLIFANVAPEIPPGYEPPLIHKTAPEKAGPPGDVLRPEQVPYMKTGPAFYAFKGDGSFVGLALATGDGFEGPYKLFPTKIEHLYPFHWGQWSKYSSKMTLSGYLYDPAPTGDLWDAWRKQWPNFLPPRKSRKSSDDPPQMLFAWEYPPMHESMVVTDYTPGEYVSQFSMDGCKLDWRWCGNCVSYGFVTLYNGSMYNSVDSNGSWQLRVAPVPAWPTGPVIMTTRGHLHISESGKVHTHTASSHCLGSCDPGL